jgi:MoaA/NifB/PqqE/SkfB family radical SAM enzyme
MALPKLSSENITADNIVKGVKYGALLFEQIVKKVPIAVNYDLTWQCNLRCEHCYFFSSAAELELGSVNERNDLTDKQWSKIFKYHSDLGVQSAALTGGEPTLRMPLIEQALEYFPKVQVATNGLIKIPQFEGTKQPLIWVSLDGSKETHNQMRGANVFDKVIDNIRDDKRVLISCTVTSQNYMDIEGAVQSAYEAGISGIFFLWYTGYDNDPLLLTGESKEMANNLILKVMEEYGDFILISRKMLELYNSKEFIQSCIFRKRNRIFSYYPNGKRKYCVMGNSPELCRNCGCIVPVALYALSKFDDETIRKLRKFNF